MGATQTLELPGLSTKTPHNDLSLFYKKLRVIDFVVNDGPFLLSRSFRERGACNGLAKRITLLYISLIFKEYARLLFTTNFEWEFTMKMNTRVFTRLCKIYCGGFKIHIADMEVKLMRERTIRITWYSPTLKKVSTMSETQAAKEYARQLKEYRDQT